VPENVHSYVVHPSTPILCDAISLLGGHISLKVATNIHCVSGRCWRGF